MGCFRVLKNKKKKSNLVSKNNPSGKEEEKSLNTLPEPIERGRSLQSAPPSFKNTSKLIQCGSLTRNIRARALSAPSSLLFIESEEHEERQSSRPSLKDQRASIPQPLPLPEPKNSAATLKNLGSFKASASLSSGPLPLPPFRGMRSFSFTEVAAACQDFSGERCVSEGISSVVYAASFGDDATSSKRIEASVSRILSSSQGFKEFVNEVILLSSLQHPHLCKLIGFHASEASSERILVYERLHHGSLDRLLYGKSDGPSIDWAARMKVALCAAKGLLFLHEEGPFQAMYKEFSTSNIQIDKDFSAKLSGYGCVSNSAEAEIFHSSDQAAAGISVETLEKGLLTPKSNVWSLGVVLLELLTGRKHLDHRLGKEERNLVRWSRPYLTDSCRLSLIMDPSLKGRLPLQAAGAVAELASKCLQKDPAERPTMRAIVEVLEQVQEMKYSCRFRLREPASVAGGAAAGKFIQRSPSLNGIVVPMSRLISPPRPSQTLPLPPRQSSTFLVH